MTEGGTGAPPGRHWRRWMEIGLGAMGLSAPAFWNLSLREWNAALDGFLAHHGLDAPPPLSRTELKRLLARDGAVREDTEHLKAEHHGS